jgi:fumarate reductase subunit C
MTRSTLILSDSLFVITITVMHFENGDFNKNPVILNLLVVVALASCILRHINYYRLTRKLY